MNPRPIPAKFGLLLSLVLPFTVWTRAAGEAVITLQPDKRLGRIEPAMHGQFIEHLGTCIQGGVFEPGSPLADENGFRNDVLEKTRELNPRLLRWPGGTYTKIYHWQDGVGPANERKRRPNLIWGGEEDHLFGTNEFIRYCRLINAEPYISVNMGTGTAEEASNWVEYCNGTGNTHYANLRRKHGFPEPHNVKFWGLGNEEEAEPDCGRLQDPEEYARTAWQFAKLMKLQDPSIKLIVAGVSGDMEWNKTLLDSLHPVADFISAHWYLRAPDFPGLLGSVAAFDGRLAEWEKFLNTYPAKPEGFSQWYRFPSRQGKVRLAIDEWGLWVGGQGGRDVLWNLNQTYTWQDALAVASWLNSMRRHSDLIGFANWAQLVNIIAPIRADKNGSVRQTLFHPLALYSNRCGQWTVATRTESPLLEGTKLPVLDVSASLHEADGKLSLFVVNRHPQKAITATINLADRKLSITGGIELTASAMTDSNTLADPGRDCVRRKTLSPSADLRSRVFPPASITVIDLAPLQPEGKTQPNP